MGKVGGATAGVLRDKATLCLLSAYIPAPLVPRYTTHRRTQRQQNVYQPKKDTYGRVPCIPRDTCTLWHMREKTGKKIDADEGGKTETDRERERERECEL